jgi:hypothetical protein
MQATIGNRATTEMLARSPETTAAKESVSVAGFGEYKMYSYHRKSSSTVAVSLDAADDAAKFFTAAAQGKPIATVTISVSGHSFTLSEVLIASVQTSAMELGPTMLTVEFNAASIKMD